MTRAMATAVWFSALLLCNGTSTSAGFAAETNANVAVPAFTIYPGDAITEGSLVERPAGRGVDPETFATNRSALVGMIARRTLIAGKPVPADAVRRPEALRQGQTVTLVFTSGNLTIRGSGLALQSGGLGEIVRVRNADSGLVVRGRILDARTVEISRP